jgi:hypothetical protein
MSSIVISGDISGTVTLDAPATAGTTVLTLPSTSGTVVTTATTTGISGSAITTGTVGVSVGGTGANTLTANNVILGNGTSAVQFVAPGSSGNVLTSNGTTWTSAAASGGQFQTQLFTAPGTWTKPASCTQVRVTVIGGGGPSYPGVPSGGTSSFGPAVSATGGTSFSGPGGSGTPGSGTVSVGTALKTGNMSSPLLGFAFASIGIISGLNKGTTSPSSGAAIPYTTSSPIIAGAARQGAAPGNAISGAGGLAIAMVPVSNPVTVTVGEGGSNPIANGGYGGAVVVEFVG